MPQRPAGAPPEDGLRRVLGGVDAAALAVGIVVGTGIFAVPGFVARELGSPAAILLAWTLGGAIALCGALTYAELGPLFPRQGGAFVYVRHAFGPLAAFFQGWGSFLVGYPASSAGIATVLGIYVAELLGLGPGAVCPAAVGAAGLVWLGNLRGTRFSARLQTGLTLGKVALLALLALLALAVGPGRWSRLAAAGEGPGPGAGALAAALVGVLWTYDGWQNLAVVGGEIRDPGRRIARALALTIGTVTAVYLLLNVSYLVLLPLEQLRSTDAVASAAARAVLGPAGGRLFALVVVLSAFGALYGIAIAGPRYFYAMGREGLFFAAAARVTPGRAAPRWGAGALFAMTVLYILTGSFEEILGYYVAISLLYNVLAVASVYRLRARFPDRPRPFRVPGYPLVPAVFIAAALWVAGNEVARSPLRTGVGLGVLVSAVPAYFLWRRRAAGRNGRGRR